MQTVLVVDSHTAGEPTRLVIENGPELRGDTMMQRRADFARHCDAFRTGVILEPRGWDALVGAVMTPPVNRGSVCGVVFFNNVGMLNMCGHAMIGVAITLQDLDRIVPGHHQVDTPAGVVSFELEPDGQHVRLQNVASRRIATNVSLTLPSRETVVGDIAWGGNWFYIVRDHSADLNLWSIDCLLDYSKVIRKTLDESGIQGEGGAVIDHVELFASGEEADGRNFVLCPGGQWDRSPCGTGTSAKVACLAADGLLQPGEVWRQQGIIGSQFEASYQIDPAGDLIPTIRGAAYVTGKSELVFRDEDPFRDGIHISTSRVSDR